MTASPLGFGIVPDPWGCRRGHRFLRVLVGLLMAATAAAAVPTSGLVAHWTMDEGSGTTVADSVGSYPGTLVGGGWSTSGHIAGAVSAKSNGQINLGTSAALQPASLTLSFWFRRTGTLNGTQHTLFWAKTGAWNSAGWYIECEDVDGQGDKALVFGLDGANFVYVSADPDTFFPLQQWTHIALTFTGTTKAIYRNGVAQTLVSSGTAWAITPSATSAKYIGGSVLADIDQMRLYSQAVTAAEALDLALERTAVWTGGGGDANWTTTANWQNSVVPIAGDTVVFAGTVNTAPVNNYAADTAFRAIAFRAGGFNVTGNGVALTTGITASAGASTFACPITLAGGQTWSAAPAATTLTVSGTVATAGATLTIDGSGSGTISGVISGTGGLLKLGTGAWSLTATNTYTGDTTLQGGALRPTATVVASTNGGFGNSANPVYLDGGEISVNTATFSRAITALTGGGSVTAYGSARSVSSNIALTSSADTARGLVASFVLSTSSAMRGVLQDDWRLTQTVVGTRIDANVLQTGTAFGTAAERAAYGIAGSDTDWNYFAIQWDGWIRIPNDGVDLFTRSDDSSRVWLDRNSNGAVDSGEWVNNGWGLSQGETTVLLHDNVAAGVYRIRVQYEEGDVTNAMSLCWNAAAKGGAHGQMASVPAGAFCGFALGSDFATGADGQQLTVTGTISGAGALTKTGTSTAIVDAVTATGATYCDGAGTLQLGAANLLSDAALVVESASTLDCANFTETVGAVYGAGAITLGSATLTVGADGGSATFGGVISGTGPVIKTGSGTQTFSGANTYSGATTVSVGTLTAAHATALGTTAAGTTVTSGACLTIAGAAVGAETVSLAGTGVVSGGALAGTGTGSLSGAVTMTADSSFGSTGTLTLSGAIGGVGFELTKVGSGVVALSAVNGYSGATTVSAGTLRLAGDTGTIVLSGAVTVGSGATLDISNAGTANPNRIGDSVVVSMNGATLSMTAPSNTNRTETIGGLSFTGGANKVFMTPAGTGNCWLTATTTAQSNSATLRFQAATASITGTGRLILSDQVNGTVLPWTLVTTWVANISRVCTQEGVYSTTVSGAAVLGLVQRYANVYYTIGGGTWTQKNNWSGPTNIFPTSGHHAIISSGHTITLAAAQAIGSIELQGGSVTVASGTPVLTVESGVVDMVGSALDYTAGTSTGSSTIAVGITANPATSLAVTTVPGTSLTVSGVASGAIALTKSGTGTLTFSGANTYNGATTVIAGTLAVASGGALSSSSSTTVTSGATLDIGTALGAEPITVTGTGAAAVGALTGTGTGSCSGAVTLSGDTTIGGPGTLTLSGVVGGGFALTKLGVGTLILSGLNTYSGATTITVGRIRAGHANALGATTAGTTVASGAVLNINGVTLAAEPLTLTGTGAGFGALTGSATAAMPGAVTLTSACGIGGGGTLTISGVISGTGSLTKQDAGTLILGAVNTYTGTTTIAGGIARAGQDVVASSNGAFGNAASAIQVTGGAIESATTTFSRAIDVGTAGGRLDGYGATRTMSSTLSVAATTAPNQGLSGSYVATGLRAVTEDDWRSTRTIAGTRVDATITYSSFAWGTAAERAAFGIGGDDGNWSDFSVQWDGYLQVATTCAISTRSDDNSRVWLDLDADDVVDAGEWGSNNWGVAGGQGVTTRTTHASVAPGVYRIRIQYDEGNGDNYMWLLWNDAANSAGVIDSLYVIPAARLSSTGFAAQVGGITAASAAGQQLTLSGAISGAGGLEKIGTSTVVVTGADTRTGTTTVTAGTLALGAADRLPATALSVASGATFDLAGFNETVGTLSGAGTVTLGIATLTTGDATATTFSGAIGGSGGLTKQGAGTFTLSGTNGFTGATTINAGTLLLAGGAALADAGAVVLADVAGAALELNAANETIGSLAGGGASGGNVILGARVLTIGGTTTTTYDGVISGTGAVTRSGSGVQTLTRACTFTGTTTVSAGTLNVNAANSSATGSLTGTGTIGGTGTVGALTSTAASNATVIRPGTAASRGTFKAGATNLSAGTNPTVQVRIAGFTTAGTSYDRLDLATATAALTLGGSSTLLLDLSGVTTVGTATGVITCAGTPSGTFTTVTVSNNPTGFAVTVQYSAASVNVIIAAGTRYWDGGGADNLWSTAANWANDTVPDTNVIATFHATQSNKACTVDAAANTYVAGIAVIGGYTGTITQTASVPVTIIGDAGFTMSSASATYTCNDTLFTPSFNQTAGTWSTSGTLCLLGKANGTLNATSTLNNLEVEGLDTGLVGYWKLDEPSGATCYDYSGNGYNGTYTGNGGTKATPSSVTKASLAFANAQARDFVQGSRQRIAWVDSAPLQLATGYTLAAWTRISAALPAQAYLMTKWTGGADGYTLAINGSNQLYAIQNGSASAASAVDITGTWQHLASTWDGTTISTYINGVLKQTLATSTAPAVNTSQLYCGQDGGSNCMNGYLDDMRIYNRALTASELVSLSTGYNGLAAQAASFACTSPITVNGHVKIWSGTLAPGANTVDVKGSWYCYGALSSTGAVTFSGTGAGNTIVSTGSSFANLQVTGSGSWNVADSLIATGTVTVSAGTLTQAAGATITAGAWTQSAGTFTGNSTGTTSEMMRIGGAFALSGTGAFTSTRSSLVVGGDFTVSAGTFTHNSGTVLLKSATSRTLTCSQTFNHLAFSDGLVARWRFEETATPALDTSGYGHSATWINGPTADATVKPILFWDNARALTFDGTDDYLDVSDGAEFQPSSALTVATWVRKPTAGASFVDEGGIIGRQSGTGTRGWSLQELTSEGDLYFRINHTQNTNLNLTIAGVTRDVWHHVAVTFNSTLVTGYLDGVQVATSAVAAGTVVNPSPAVLWIGRQSRYGASNAPKYGGKLDDLRFYDRDLPAADIKRLASGRESASSVATFTLASNLTLAGDLTIGSGTLDLATRAVGVAGNWRCGGVLVGGTSTVTFNGAATTTTITCGSQAFANVVVAGAGSTYTCSDAFRATGTFTQSAGTFVGNARPITVGGNMSLNAGTFQATSDITTCGGDLSDASGGTFVANAGVVRLTASSAKTLTMTDAFNHLWIASGGDTGMVARFRLDEAQPGSVVDDVSGIVATCSGTPTVSSSMPTSVALDPYGLDFSGAETGTDKDYVQVATGSALDTIQNNDYSISAWFKPRTIPPGTGAQNRAFYAVAAKPGLHIGLFFNGDRKFVMGARISGAVDVGATSVTTYTAGSWYHLCGVFDRTNGMTAIYVDGVRVGTTAFTAGTAVHAIYDTAPWRFGIVNPSAGANDYMWPADGFIDDVRFYSRALTAPEALALTAGGIDAASGTATISLATPAEVDGDVVLVAGTLSAGVHQVNAAANWRNYLGTTAFNGGSAAVVLDGTNQQLYGSTTFNHFTKSVTSAATLTFPIFHYQTINGTMTLNGAAGQLLSIVSSTSGMSATIKPYGARVCSYLSVKDSRNFVRPTINPANSTNAGNTQLWFGAAPSGNVMTGAPAVQ